MLVDPEFLRAFASQVDSAAADIGAADVGGRTFSAGDALPGSTTQWAVRALREHLNRMATRLAENVTKTGTAVRGAGEAFEVTDDVLAGQFDGLF